MQLNSISCVKAVLIVTTHLFDVFNEVVEETVCLPLWLWREIHIIVH